MTRWLWLLVIVSGVARADEYHYKDILIGERAAGLGGAFVAISDDPSGIYYNPAGLVFSENDYLSISANAYSSSKETYKDIFDGQNYDYRSSTLIPSLFAFMQGVGRYKVGFAVIVPRAEVVDQSDTVTDTRNSDVTKQNKFTRRLFSQDTTYLFGPAISREISNNFSVGISLLGFARVMKFFDNQLVLFGSDGNGKYYLQETHMTREAYGIYPKVGIQYMPAPHWSIGLVVAKPFNISGATNYAFTHTKTDPSQSSSTPPTGIFNDDLVTTRLNLGHSVTDPLEVSAGVAYFPSKDWLFTLQADGFEGRSQRFPVRATFNVAAGAEFFPAEWVAVRGGLFTNNANTHKVEDNSKNQEAHVDLLGASLGFSVYRTGTSLTLGGNYSWGRGKGQAFSDSASIQAVETSNFTIQLSGSYQL